jgi:hypothetical protein
MQDKYTTALIIDKWVDSDEVWYLHHVQAIVTFYATHARARLSESKYGDDKHKQHTSTNYRKNHG